MSKKNRFVKVTNGRFVTVVQEETATVATNGSSVLLYFEEDDRFMRVPDGVNLNADWAGQKLNVTIRQGFGDAVLVLGPDDVTAEQLEADDTLVPVTSLEEIEDLATEYRMQTLSKYSSYLVNFLAGLALLAVSVYCVAVGSSIAAYAIIGIVGGACCAVFTGALPFAGMIRRLSSDVVADSYGNTINLKTGECSLNGGCTLAAEEGGING